MIVLPVSNIKNTSCRIILVLSGVFLSLIIFGHNVHADYIENNLIDDITFVDSKPQDMDSISKVQAFLSSKGGYISNYSSYSGRDSKNVSSAQIIYEAAQDYGISPKVILATMQKEESLVTDPSPVSAQLNFAMGYGCYDATGCSNYYGFYNQVANATWQLRMNFERAGGNNTWWNPNTGYACNGPSRYYSAALTVGNYVTFYDDYGTAYKSFTIKNAATASLYCYTPHAYPGSEANYYSGSYNFVTMYESWFGTVRAFKPLETPRWMELTDDIYKKNPVDGSNVDGLLPEGTQLRFNTKVLVDGQWYMRSEYDTSNNFSKGILLSDLQEIPYKPIDVPYYMELAKDTNKVDPRSSQTIKNQYLKRGTQIKISDKITVNGTDYYRSYYDNQNGLNSAVTASDLTDITFTPFDFPRYMNINQDTHALDPATGVAESSIITKGTQLKFTSKITVDGVAYFRSSDDTTRNAPRAINSIAVSEISFVPYGDKSKWLQLKSDSEKITAPNSDHTGVTISAGLQLHIIDKVLLQGQWYYRTEYDHSLSLNQGLPSDNFEEIPFENMETPRIMQLSTDTSKIFPKTGQVSGGVLPKGLKLMFKTKISINGKLYLRTEYDTNTSAETAIPFDKIIEAK